MKSLSVDRDHHETGCYVGAHGEGVYYTDWVVVEGEWLIYRTQIFLPYGYDGQDHDAICRRISRHSMCALKRLSCSDKSMLETTPEVPSDYENESPTEDQGSPGSPEPEILDDAEVEATRAKFESEWRGID